MTAAKPVIDWPAHPQPWRTIGPQFRAQCEAIARGEMPAASRRKGGPKVNFVPPTEQVPPEGA